MARATAAPCRVLRCLARSFSSSSGGEAPRPTSLHDLHVAHGGKMVDFAGFLLPVTYKTEDGHDAHAHTRTKCSLFDVSHMLQTEIRGKDRYELMERLTTADLSALPSNGSTLTVFTDAKTGGILDDLVVTKTALGYLYVVSNAARRDHDINLMKTAEEELRTEGKGVELHFLDPAEASLLALQGPQAMVALQPLVDVDLECLPFMRSTLASIDSVRRVRITRCGYTGEDGFEIAVPSPHAEYVATKLLASTKAHVRMAGLGARDSLRLEAGLCLYGSDLDETTTPVEASLSWLIAKRRREAADFPGAAVILDQLRDGPSRRRVGLRWMTGPPARGGAALYSEAGENVGKVTSGCPSPTLGGNIAMGYVATAHAKAGTKLQVEVRGKKHPVEVAKMPFVKPNYFK